MCSLEHLQHSEQVIGKMNLIHNYGESSHVNHSFRMSMKGNTYLPNNKEKVLDDIFASKMNSKLKGIKSNDCHLV